MSPASQAAGLARGHGLSLLQPHPWEAAPARASIPVAWWDGAAVGRNLPLLLG